jgi:hypothetical protein
MQCNAIYREEHIQKKIDGMIVEAKAKMAKGDKKGVCVCVFCENSDGYTEIGWLIKVVVILIESCRFLYNYFFFNTITHPIFSTFS